MAPILTNDSILNASPPNKTHSKSINAQALMDRQEATVKNIVAFFGNFDLFFSIFVVLPQISATFLQRLIQLYILRK